MARLHLLLLVGLHLLDEAGGRLAHPLLHRGSRALGLRRQIVEDTADAAEDVAQRGGDRRLGRRVHRGAGAVGAQPGRDQRRSDEHLPRLGVGRQSAERRGGGLGIELARGVREPHAVQRAEGEHARHVLGARGCGAHERQAPLLHLARREGRAARGAARQQDGRVGLRVVEEPTQVELRLTGHAEDGVEGGAVQPARLVVGRVQPLLVRPPPLLARLRLLLQRRHRRCAE
mmetsp:Transcript_66541/g.160653  ORF Transcript_66541/g.160653 Transcript_66541/m.160653 type:complete len:231 (+) Transcript_66541:1254-1946(+)